MRVGFGYDVHRLTEGRRLVLGGVEVPYGKGLLGHSDADVLVHAIIDALLGAAALGDLGSHFPPTDPQYKDISSLELLRRIRELLKRKGYKISNIDSTVVCQEPRLSDNIPEMVENISGTLEVEAGRMNIKATTEEGMGFTGSGSGVSAYAVALLEEKKGR
jgi:2-C-methyl-D-erythritol 2,4-cyclodiphosphate synthase